MKRLLTLLVFGSVIITLALTPLLGAAQGSGPLLEILGKPRASTTAAEASVKVSVVDPNTGRAFTDLTNSNFAVELSGEPTQTTVAPELNGLAVVIVVDRGGISRARDPRIGQAVDLVSSFLGTLTVDGSATADMVALIGVRGREDQGERDLTPLVPFTDSDPNSISNEFDLLRTEVVDETTPLYDGLDAAIEWLTENADPQIQEKLATRRKLILVFSDGIDRGYSDKAHEATIVTECRENGIQLHGVLMASTGAVEEGGLKTLTSQTKGQFFVYNQETAPEVEQLFGNLLSQRQAYRVTFPLRKPQGEYEMVLKVQNTPIGAASETAFVSSRLQTQKLNLIPPPDTGVTVPYSKTVEGFLPTQVEFKAEIITLDGISREPAEVIYFANGVRIGSSGTAPDYPMTWDLTYIIMPTDEAETRDYTIIAIANDPYLNDEMISQGLSLRVTWQAKEKTAPETVVDTVEQNWLAIVLFVLLGIALLVLLILLIKTRGQIARTAVNKTTSALRGMTQRLGAGGVPAVPAHGKLVVTRGANVGREYRLASQLIKVGRDPQFSDFALMDQYASNPHFSVMVEQGNFFIQDEGSTNGTKLNGTPLAPHQRYPLQPDSIIEVGQTRLQLKRLGGETRRLSNSDKAAAQQPAAPTQRTGGAPGQPPFDPRHGDGPPKRAPTRPNRPKQ